MLSKAAANAVKKYGEDNCRKAYALCDKWGFGPHGILLNVSGPWKTVQAVNAAIDAGRELSQQEQAE